ncbi:hypothetical protein [Ensifer canadensis]
MAPLPLSAINDRLPIASVRWTIQRSDELSGMGSGNFWVSEMAPPLWNGEMTFGRGHNDDLKQVAAYIRRVAGRQQTFLLCDPLSPFPQSDPKGLILGASNVTLGQLVSDRYVAHLVGLPAGYVLTVGDKMQIAFAETFAFIEVSETLAASPAGAIEVPIYPYLPLPVVAGAQVILKRPACPVRVLPEGHEPGTARKHLTDGAGVKVIQRAF